VCTFVSPFLWILELTIFFLHVRCIESSRLAYAADPTYLHQFIGSVILDSRDTVQARLYRPAHTLFRVHIYLQSVRDIVIDPMQVPTSDSLLQRMEIPWKKNETFYGSTISFPLFNFCFNIMAVFVSIPKSAKDFSCFKFSLLKLDNSHGQATFFFNILALTCDKVLTSYKTNYLII
jgi:hypothetical protein